jgi:uncharacterized protein (DUF1330 family)
MGEHIDPTGDQIGRLAEASSDGSPIVMLNLLRFADLAGGELADEGISGEQAYGRYAAAAAPHLERVGGRILYAGRCADAVIGPEGEWDVVAAVSYPSRAAFLEMIGDPDYQAITHLRTNALAEARLIVTDEANDLA